MYSNYYLNENNVTLGTIMEQMKSQLPVIGIIRKFLNIGLWIMAHIEKYELYMCNK